MELFRRGEIILQLFDLFRPRTSRLGRQASSDSLNRVAFSTHFDPPNWSTGRSSASRRMSRSETPNYIEVFRASSSLGQGNNKKCFLLKTV